jgi:MFS family permease
MTASFDRVEAPGKSRAWLAWMVSVAFVIYYFSFQTGYSIVNPSVQKDLGLSITQIGIVAAVYTWVFAVCQFFSGPLLDRLGARMVLLPSVVLTTIGVLIFANSTNFGTLLLSQFFIAVGACSGFVGAGYVGGKWFGMAKFSFMFGLVQFSASLFSAFNQNLLSLALTSTTWQSLFNWVAGLGVLLLAAAIFWLRDPAPISATASAVSASFLTTVFRSLVTVAKVPHIWFAAGFGSLCFGAMLSLGVVWGPKLLTVKGLEPSVANSASSFFWLGLAAGCFLAPTFSDRLRRRKLPILIGIVLQIFALLMLLYVPSSNASTAVVLCFLFGLGNSAHMLAFSTAADVVEPETIGTSAAIVNGMMFLVGGVLISRPGVLIGRVADVVTEPASLEIAQLGLRPLVLGLVVAFAIAAAMRETYHSQESPEE